MPAARSPVRPVNPLGPDRGRAADIRRPPLLVSGIRRKPVASVALLLLLLPRASRRMSFMRLRHYFIPAGACLPAGVSYAGRFNM